MNYDTDFLFGGDTTPAGMFPGILAAMTSALLTTLIKAHDYPLKTQAPRNEIEKEIDILRARYANNINTQRMIDDWLAADELPVTMRANARLCLQQIALMQSTLQDSIKFLRSRLPLAPNPSQFQYTHTPIDQLPVFLDEFEKDLAGHRKVLAKYQRLALERAPLITVFDLTREEHSIRDQLTALDLAEKQLDYWAASYPRPTTSSCRLTPEENSMRDNLALLDLAKQLNGSTASNLPYTPIGNFSHPVLIQACRQHLSDIRGVLAETQLAISALHKKTLEAQLAAGDAKRIPTSQKN